MTSREIKNQRIEIAKKRALKQDEAVLKREHAEGLVWLAIESAPSIPMLDDQGAFIADDDGNMMYCADNEKWTPMMPDDVPEWLKEPGVINELRSGVELSKNPGEGGLWYHGVICSPPDESHGVAH